MREGSPNRLYAIHPLSDSPTGGKSLFQNILPASHSFSIFYRPTGVPRLPKSKKTRILRDSAEKKYGAHRLPELSRQFVFGTPEQGSHGADYPVRQEHDDHDEDGGQRPRNIRMSRGKPSQPDGENIFPQAQRDVRER